MFNSNFPHEPCFIDVWRRSRPVNATLTKHSLAYICLIGNSSPTTTGFLDIWRRCGGPAIHKIDVPELVEGGLRIALDHRSTLVTRVPVSAQHPHGGYDYLLEFADKKSFDWIEQSEEFIQTFLIADPQMRGIFLTMGERSENEAQIASNLELQNAFISAQLRGEFSLLLLPVVFAIRLGLCALNIVDVNTLRRLRKENLRLCHH